MATLDYESAVIDFLARKENLRFVFEIGERLEKIKEKLQLSFWHLLENRVKEQTGSINGWKLILSPEQELLKRNTYGGLWLNPTQDTSALYLYPGIFNDEDGYLEFGVLWNKETKDVPRSKEIDVLREELKELGYDTEKTYNWWLGVNYSGLPLRDKPYILRMSDGSLSEEFASAFTIMFDHLRTLIERANETLIVPKRR